MRRIFSLPNRKKIAKGAQVWPFHPKPHQESVPKDGRLLQKLGVEPGSDILFFAGGYGDWAQALQKGSKVFYTDISPKMVEGVQKFRGIKKAKVRHAMFSPQASEKYDWSFSFEPFPLMGHGFPLVAVRSLLNRKGLKVILGRASRDSSARTRFDKIMRLVKECYPIELQVETFLVRIGFNKTEEHKLYTLKTTDIAREKARQDLRVLKAAEKLPEAGIVELAKKLKIKGKAVQESLERWHKLSLEMPNMIEEKTFKSRRRGN